MDEKPIKTELFNEENLEISNCPIEKKSLNEELEKDIPDFVNVNNYAGTIPEEELREIYYCNYCKNKYGKFEYLQIHEYVHDPKKHCPICNFTFSAKKNFIVHINGHIKEKMEDERRSLFCDFCKKPFRKRRALTLHLRVHTNERPYKCHICGKAFKQKGSLTDHNTTHTNIKAFPCETCSGSFTTASSLRRHIRRIHDAGKTYSCRICSLKLDNYTCLQLHRAEQHPEASERCRCPICPMVFKSVYAFRKHKKEHESNGEITAESSPPPKKFRCVLCGEKFLNCSSYVAHKETHFYYKKEDYQKVQENGLFSCKLCDRDFQTKEGLFKHMAFHMEKTEKCNICQEFFSYYGYTCHKRRVHLPLECKICKEILAGTGRLIRHYRSTHPDLNGRDRKHACPICDKLYQSKYPLEMHMQIYHGKSDITKTHSCNICARQFTTRAVLGAHIGRVHPASARFKCDSCNILFQNRSKLLRHDVMFHQENIKKRRKNKSRLCPHCNQVFYTMPLLKHHVRTKHAIVKSATKFQCKICLRYFKNSRNRRDHLRNKVCTKFFEKTKKNLYKCTVCRKGFALRFKLIAHMVVHSKFYKTCRFCNKTYTRMQNLRIHIQNRHPNEKPYYCGFCNMEFDNVRQLKSHRFTSAHKGNIEFKTEVVEEPVVNSISEETIIKEDVEMKDESVD